MIILVFSRLLFRLMVKFVPLFSISHSGLESSFSDWLKAYFYMSGVPKDIYCYCLKSFFFD